VTDGSSGCARVGGDGRAAVRLGERWRAGDERLVVAALRWAHAKLASLLRLKYFASLSREQADGIAVSAVEHAWERRAAFDTKKGTLKGWVWTIADHLALEELGAPWHKKRDRATAASDDWQTALPDPHAAVDIEDAATDVADIRPEILQAMDDRLSSNEEAVLLADARSPGGIAPAAELATELGISLSAVYVHRSRGKKRLGPELEARGLAPKAHAASGGDSEPRAETIGRAGSGESDKNGAEV